MERAHPDGQRKIQRLSMAYRRHTHSQKAACTLSSPCVPKALSPALPLGGGSRLPKPHHWLHKPKKQPALSEFGSAGCFLNTQSITAGTAASDIRA